MISHTTYISDIKKRSLETVINNWRNIVPDEFGRKIWPYSLDKNGYPKVSVSLVTGEHARNRFVHRIIYEYFVRHLNKGEVVMHLDDNPLNVSLENLKAGSVKENNLDKLNKGRAGHGGTPRFSSEQVLDIRKKYSEGLSLSKLAIFYNVGRGVIYQIVKFKTYKYIQK